MALRDETLMAFADGELPAAEAADVERAVQTDPALQARLNSYRATRDIVAKRLKPLADEAVPSELEQAVRSLVSKSQIAPSENVVAFTPRSRESVMARRWSLPLAASIAAVAAGLGGFGLGWNAGGQGDGIVVAVGRQLPVFLENALQHATAGSETELDGRRVRVIATVRAEDGTVCREFELDILAERETTAGIACRRDDHWRLDIAVAAAATDEGFAPASSLTALDSYLDAIGASEPLTPEEEKATLDLEVQAPANAG